MSEVGIVGAVCGRVDGDSDSMKVMNRGSKI